MGCQGYLLASSRAVSPPVLYLVFQGLGVPPLQKGGDCLLGFTTYEAWGPGKSRIHA
jgi:hypothetical protein